jgi:chromosome segregation ATPase
MNAQAENKVLQEKVETLASQFRVLSERMRGIESSGRNIEAQADAQRAKNGVLEEQLRDERRRWEEERQRRVEAEMRCEKAEQAWHEFEVKVGYMQKQVEDAMRDRQRTTEALRIKEREVEECVRMLAEMNNHK